MSPGGVGASHQVFQGDVEEVGDADEYVKGRNIFTGFSMVSIWFHGILFLSFSYFVCK
jgi:hypothetical protein